jgi:hypothetical protein
MCVYVTSLSYAIDYVCSYTSVYTYHAHTLTINIQIHARTQEPFFAIAKAQHPLDDIFLRKVAYPSEESRELVRSPYMCPCVVFRARMRAYKALSVVDVCVCKHVCVLPCTRIARVLCMLRVALIIMHAASSAHHYACCE